ncbi:TetR/AcrR family transcriptional regulator [Mariniluteicoccus endophyticus]
MPKIVDHEARREELAGAVWRLVGRAGITGASVRAVAAESGWSMGAVRHYFSTQDELLGFAIEVMTRRIQERITALYTEEPTARGDASRAAATLEQMLPMDADRRVEVLVWLAYMARARSDDALDGFRQTSWNGSRLVCRTAVADALGLPLPRSHDERLPDTAERLVTRVHLVIDGLSVQGATYPEHWPAERLHAEVGDLLADVEATWDAGSR